MHILYKQNSMANIMIEENFIKKEKFTSRYFFIPLIGSCAMVYADLNLKNVCQQ